MSASKRERERERRRAAKWAQKQAAAAKVRRERSIVAVCVVVGLAVLLIVGLVFANRADDEPLAGATPSGTPSTADDGSSPEDPAGEDPAGGALPTTNPRVYSAPPPAADSLAASWTATIATSLGEVVVELDGAAAPQAVANFLFLAQEGFYDGTACHRLLPTALLQCGDPTATGTGNPGYRFGPIENAPAGDVYPAGALAMARSQLDGESQGSQFFLVFDEVTLPADAAGGYTVFGTVTQGLDVLQQIGAAGTIDGSSDGRPAVDVIIEGVSVSE